MSELRLEAEEAVGDDALLRRFVSGREADAFAELARRHIGLVFGTCLRVTGDRHDAEELTQDCFFRLASRASSVRISVAGWLHATATRLALNAVRARGRRRAHEARAIRGHAGEPTDSSWREVEPILDEAVDALPHELREAIVLHFLRSLPQTEVAARLGVHQSTVSRRIAEGLRRLNERLGAAGVTLSAVPLVDLLLAHATPDGVPDVTRASGRVALAGATGGVLGAAGAGWAKVKAAILLIVGSLPSVVVEAVAGVWPGIAVAVACLGFLAWRRPSWMDELFPSPDGRSRYDSPFWPFQRWAWAALPVGWKSAMFGSLAVAMMFGVQAWAFSQARAEHRGFSMVGVLATYGALSFSTFLRIAWKAVTLRVQVRDSEAAAQTTALDAATVAQAVGVAFTTLLMLPCFGLAMSRFGERPAVVAAWVILLILMTGWTWIDAILKVRRYLKEAPATAFAVESEPRAGTRSRNAVIAVHLGFSAYLTLASMAAGLIRSTNPQYAASPQGVRHLEGAAGIVPPLQRFTLGRRTRMMVIGP